MLDNFLKREGKRNSQSFGSHIIQALQEFSGGLLYDLSFGCWIPCLRKFTSFIDTTHMAFSLLYDKPIFVHQSFVPRMLLCPGVDGIVVEC